MSNGIGGKKKNYNGPSDVKDLIPAGMIPVGNVLPTVDAKYTVVGESLRKNVPHEMQEKAANETKCILSQFACRLVLKAF
jgi:hypothetical protein